MGLQHLIHFKWRRFRLRGNWRAGMVGSRGKKLISPAGRKQGGKHGRIVAPQAAVLGSSCPLFNSTHLSECRPIGLPSVSITHRDLSQIHPIGPFFGRHTVPPAGRPHALLQWPAVCAGEVGPLCHPCQVSNPAFCISAPPATQPTAGRPSGSTNRPCAGDHDPFKAGPGRQRW